MEEPARLIEGLKRQRAAYGRIAEISRGQRALLEANDLDALLSLVEEKRKRMVEAEESKQSTADLMSRWPEMRKTLDPALVREVESEVSATRDLLEEILRREEEDRDLFEQERKSRSEEIHDLHQRKKARDAYGGQHGSGETRFLDDKK